MAAIFNPRDKSRTTGGKTYNLVRKNTKPPIDQNGFGWFTGDLMASVAFRSLSKNAMLALFRLVVEHIGHAGLNNGSLVVTHEQFIAYGVSGEYVADAIDELTFKGLVRVKRGRAGNGTSHPNTYTLTYTGDCEGAQATNEWQRCTPAMVKAWTSTIRKQMADRRAAVGRKKNTPLRTSEISPLRTSEIRRLVGGSLRRIPK